MKRALTGVLLVSLLWLTAFQTCWASAWSADNPALDTDEPVMSGRLRPFGHYLSRSDGATTTVLPDGSLLVYGSGSWTNGRESLQAEVETLRSRRERAYPSANDTVPKFWDHARKGWRRLAPPPECPHPARYLHTATLLKDGKVLMVGGLCDEPKLLDDRSPQRAYQAMSLLDPVSRQWQPAPSLTEARIFHTASLMPDGSVFITGGARDPGLADTPHALVLSSAEQFQSGRVVPLPAMAQARAKHTATVLADGSLLVVGGFDDTGRAMASAERWDSASRTWASLPSPGVARYSHAATLLPDGRLMVSGGIGAQGEILSSVEIWDPKARAWSGAQPLPIPLYGHTVALLASGKVFVAGGGWIAHAGRIPWAWTWTPRSDSWQVAGHVSSTEPLSLPDVSTQITVAPRPDGGALVLTPQHIMRWEPLVETDPTRMAPLWRDRPVATVLSDGRVMLVGAPDSDSGGAPHVARLWDPRTGRWADAGQLSQMGWMHASVRQLPSGQVIHVGVKVDSELMCEAWTADTNRWQACGSIHVKEASTGRVRLGLLPDGRAFAIVTDADVFVFDEAGKAWSAWQAQWQTDGMTYGSPIRGKHDLLTISSAGGGESFAINDEAARYWQNNGGGEMPASLLWDSRQRLWAYVFLGRKMGGDAQWLPDGCALSTNPLAIFDPATGRVTPQVDPGLGIAASNIEMLVLPDGTVVAAGPSEAARDPGAGFFVGKASCAGLVSHEPDEGYIAGGLAVDAPVGPVSAASQVPSSSSKLAAWLGRLKTLMPHWTVWLGGAVALLLAYAIAKSRGPLRLIMSALALALGLSAWWGTRHLPAGVLRQDASCQMVGVWSARHGSQMRRVELKDDGSYWMAPSAVGNDPAGGYRGRWSVSGGRMTWRDSRRFDGEPDINKILPDTKTRFTLVEGDGSHTVFEWIRPLPSQRCQP